MLPAPPLAGWDTTSTITTSTKAGRVRPRALSPPRPRGAGASQPGKPSRWWRGGSGV